MSLNIIEILEKLNLPFKESNIDSHNELWLPCPLPYGNHKKGDQHPSFSINLDSGKCYCFVCGGGSIEFLISAVLGISIDEAKSWIRGVQFGDESDEDFSRRIKEKMSLYQKSQSFSEIPQQFFSAVEVPEEIEFHPWLETQGISEETARKFNLFYDPRRNVIAFPHYWQGKIVGMQFRNLSNNARPKYYNTPDFPKKNTLFNYDFVDGEEAIVVESPKTVCVLDSNGHQNVIATFGASVTQEQLVPLRKFKRLYFWPDNDEPGEKALRTEIKFLKDFVDIYIIPSVDIPKGDAADIPVDQIQDYIDRAQPYLKWKLYA